MVDEAVANVNNCLIWEEYMDIHDIIFSTFVYVCKFL